MTATAEGLHHKDRTGRTALHRAAGLGDRAAVRELLDRGADPAVLDSRMGASPLHHAALSGDVEVGRMLLAAGAFPDLQSPTNGITPLMAAVWSRHPGFVALLLDLPEINTELRSTFGATAVELVGFGARPGDDRARREDDRLGHLFAEHRRRRAERLAAQELFGLLTETARPASDPDRVRRSIEGGASVDTVSPVTSSGSDGHTPLLVAARDGDVRAVAALLAAGADQTLVDHYMAAVPAHKAAYNGHAAVLRLLADAPGFDAVKDAQGPFNGYTPLHDAAWHGHLAAAEVLVAAGARTDLRGFDGRTPLDLARLHRYPELVDLLVRPAPG